MAVLAMMAGYQAWDNPTAWVYLGLHGSYGWLWVIKGRVFPDRTWQRPAGLGKGLVIIAGLSLYWLAPWIITSGGVVAPLWLLACALALFALGVLLHFGADMQKHTALKLRPNRLIREGFFRRIRNPNYLGELLIYTSFALLSVNWLPFVVLALFVLLVWLPNMRRKDRSLSRYPEFEEYRRRTYLFLPPLI